MEPNNPLLEGDQYNNLPGTDNGSGNLTLDTCLQKKKGPTNSENDVRRVLQERQ